MPISPITNVNNQMQFPGQQDPDKEKDQVGKPSSIAFQKPQEAQAIQAIQKPEKAPEAQLTPTTKMKSGGRVRGCGIAQRGLTRGKMV